MTRVRGGFNPNGGFSHNEGLGKGVQALEEKIISPDCYRHVSVSVWRLLLVVVVVVFVAFTMATMATDMLERMMLSPGQHGHNVSFAEIVHRTCHITQSLEAGSHFSHSTPNGRPERILLQAPALSSDANILSNVAEGVPNAMDCTFPPLINKKFSHQ
uniref:Uncharacterized protein n=1 Tax=Timema bartmani TaxID=61472 RepID=A0A7R9F6L0_9NEOP|nr:unnamed protein product [Timema bartmani]